jgi:multidrug resistance efflux pump
MVTKNTAQDRAQAELDRAHRLLGRANKRAEGLRAQLTVAEVDVAAANRRWEYASANPDLAPIVTLVAHSEEQPREQGSA